YDVSSHAIRLFFCFTDTSTTMIYTLSLHDALPICTTVTVNAADDVAVTKITLTTQIGNAAPVVQTKTPNVANASGVTFTVPVPKDRKSTRLNSSHVAISYAVFCLKKKKMNIHL